MLCFCTPVFSWTVPLFFYENICYSCCKGTIPRVFMFMRFILSAKLKSDEIFVVCPFIFLTAFFVAIFLCSQPFTLNLNHTGKCTVEMFFCHVFYYPKGKSLSKFGCRSLFFIWGSDQAFFFNSRFCRKLGRWKLLRHISRRLLVPIWDCDSGVLLPQPPTPPHILYLNKLTISSKFNSTTTQES